MWSNGPRPSLVAAPALARVALLCFSTTEAGFTQGWRDLWRVLSGRKGFQRENREKMITQIAKPAETDFEQNMLSMFDNKKATNLTQSL